MNAVFTVIFIISAIALTFVSPDGVLSAMLGGGQKAVELTMTMTAIYAVWLGVMKVAEDGGITEKLAKLLKRPVGWLFGSVSERAAGYITLNVSANLLGLGGVATPMGISAATELDAEDNFYAQCVLFILAATSLQLLPTSVVSLRADSGSASPGDIILPTLLATAFSTLFGLVAVRLIHGRKKKR